jgi:hypothetical protein
MYDDVDLSFLDRPEILNFIFYPRKNLSLSQRGTTHLIEVDSGIKIGCRFYLKEEDCPSILYFHGNGETVGDYDWVAPFFNQRGINLFVADYRGYGLSNGEPTITNLISDAHPIFKGFKEIIKKKGCKNSLFIMGRSLGSIPAIELAYHHQSEFLGLIIESGVANFFDILFNMLGIEINNSFKEKLEIISNKSKIKSLSIPTLIIHAEYDSLLPLREGKDLYESSGAKDKKIFIIPGADHNNLWQIAGDQYYQKIEEFIKTRLPK